MYSDTISAFHPAPQAVMLPVRSDGTIAGSSTRRQYALPRSPNDRAASFRSSGMPRTPAIRLNKRYHCMLNNAIRTAESSAAGPRLAVAKSANPTMIGNRAVAGSEAATSRTGVTYRDPRGFRPIQAASGIVHAKAMAYARPSRMNDEAAARGSSAAPGGRGLRNSRTSPTNPATTTSSKIAVNMARSRYRISRMTRRWAEKLRSSRTDARRYFVTTEPSPGRVYGPPNAVNVSLATRKNQPLLHERIELYTSFGIAAGNAKRRKRSMPRRPKLAAAASRSTGIVVRDS